MTTYTNVYLRPDGTYHFGGSYPSRCRARRVRHAIAHVKYIGTAVSKPAKTKWQWRNRDQYRGEAGWKDYKGTPAIWWAQMEYRQVPANAPV